jgi:O-acetyl-ADP-ribose deacetylase (regulator of RNase III)
MGNYREVYGDLIKMAQNGDFDAISHGANCFSVMGAGIAPQMAKAFGIDRLSMEHPATTGDINKLGQIQWKEVFIKEKPLYVINSYTQYHYKPQLTIFDIVYNNKRYYKSYDEEISHNDAMSLVLEFLKEVV